MRKKSTSSRVERLELLKSRLRIDEAISLGEVADELGVSLSTINRDVRLLREQGVPVESDRGRGGGTRINRSWGVGRISLTYHEAIDLLVSVATIEKMKVPMTMANARSIKTKLISSFSKPEQKKIKKLAKRIRVGPVSSPTMLAGHNSQSKSNIRKIQESFLFMQQAQVAYRDREGRLTKRRVEPHYLVLNHPLWYLLCFDHKRHAFRTLRCDRLEGVSVVDKPFVLRPWSDFEPSMKGNALSALL